jgi:hypothetical protein
MKPSSKEISQVNKNQILSGSRFIAPMGLLVLRCFFGFTCTFFYLLISFVKYGCIVCVWWCWWPGGGGLTGVVPQKNKLKTSTFLVPTPAPEVSIHPIETYSK